MQYSCKNWITVKVWSGSGFSEAQKRSFDMAADLYILPRMRRGGYGDGVVEGVDAIARAIIGKGFGCSVIRVSEGCPDRAPSPYEDGENTSTFEAKASLSDEQRSWEKSVYELFSLAGIAGENRLVRDKLEKLKAKVYGSRHVDNWICSVDTWEEYGDKLGIGCKRGSLGYSGKGRLCCVSYLLLTNYTSQMHDIASSRGKWVIFSGELVATERSDRMDVTVNTSTINEATNE